MILIRLLQDSNIVLQVGDGGGPAGMEQAAIPPEAPGTLVT